MRAATVAAREPASGHRADEMARVDGCPRRMDFAFAEASEISARGMSFL